MIAAATVVDMAAAGVEAEDATAISDAVPLYSNV